MVDDPELWQAARRGDHAAFGRLFERHASAVFRYCLRRTGQWAVAEDLTSVVFLETWRRRREVELTGSSVLPWLFGVALGVTRNHQRALTRYERMLARVAPPPPVEDFAEFVAVQVDAERAAQAALATLRTLPRAEREVFEAVTWMGLSHSEAADLLGIAVGTLKSRLARAVHKLRAGHAVGSPVGGQP